MNIKVATGLDDCPPPPVHVSADGILWAEESIVNARKTKGDVLVGWTGFNDPKDNTWEPLENLRHLPLLLDSYFGKDKTPDE
jgi:hypothetical protein